MSPSDKNKPAESSMSGESQSQEGSKPQSMDPSSESASSSTSDVTIPGHGMIANIPLITASLPTLKCSINDQMKTFDPGEDGGTERLSLNHSLLQGKISSSSLLKNSTKNYKAGSKINKLADMLAKRSQSVVEVTQNNATDIITDISSAPKVEGSVILNNVRNMVNFGSVACFEKTASDGGLGLFRKSRRKSVPNQSCSVHRLQVQSSSKSCSDFSKLFPIEENSKPEFNALGESLTDESTKKKVVKKNLKNVELPLILPERKRRSSMRNEHLASSKVIEKILDNSGGPEGTDKNKETVASEPSPIRSVISTKIKKESRGAKQRKSKRLVETSTQTADIEFISVLKSKPEMEEGDKPSLTYECLYCTQTFPSGSQCKAHEKTHTQKNNNKQIIKCQYCFKKLPSLDELKFHCVQKHPNKYAYCMKCDDRFATKEELYSHNKETHFNKSGEGGSQNGEGEDPVSGPQSKPEAEDKQTEKKTTKQNGAKTDLKIDVSFDTSKKSSVSPRNAQKFSPKETKTEEQLLEMEMLFYSHLSGNIQENLTNHLDGKIDKSGIPVRTDQIHEQIDSAKSSSLLSVVAPTAGVPDVQVSRAPSPYQTRSKTPNPLPPTAKKFKKLPNWQQKFWEKYNFPTNYRYEHRFWDKNYLNTEKHAVYLKDLSCLDIKTQLTMRENIKKLDNIKSMEENSKPADKLKFPDFLSLVPKVNGGGSGGQENNKSDAQRNSEQLKNKKQVRKEEQPKKSFKSPGSEVAVIKTRRKLSSDNSSVKKQGERSNAEGVKMMTRRQSSLDLAKDDKEEGAGKKRKGSLDMSGNQRMSLRRQTSLDCLQPNSASKSEKNDQILELNLSNTDLESTPMSPTNSAEISGEWVRPRSYLCGTCCTKFTNLWELEDHKWVSHPNVWCTHYEFEDEKIDKLFQNNEEEEGGGKDSAPAEFSALKLMDLYKRYLLPHGSLKTAKLVPNSNFPEQCTKCKKNCMSSSEMHKHMLDCGGDTTWFLTMYSSPMTIKRKWRPFGSRRRKQIGRRDLKRNIPSTPSLRPYHYQHRIRTKPGDVESIQKMLANLPEKRARRAINFDEIKTRSQATIRSNRLLRKRFKTTFTNNFLKMKNLKQKRQLKQGKKEGSSKSTTDTSSENTPVGSPKRRNKLKERLQLLKEETSREGSSESSGDTDSKSGKKKTQSKKKEASVVVPKVKTEKPDTVKAKPAPKKKILGSGGKSKKKTPQIKEEVTAPQSENNAVVKTKAKKSKKKSDAVVETTIKEEPKVEEVPRPVLENETAPKSVKKTKEGGDKKKKKSQLVNPRQSNSILRLNQKSKEKTELLKKIKKKLENSKRTLEMKELKDAEFGSRRSLRLKSLRSEEGGAEFLEDQLSESTKKEESVCQKDLKIRNPIVSLGNLIIAKSVKVPPVVSVKISKEIVQKEEKVASPEDISVRRSSRSLRNSVSLDEKPEVTINGDCVTPTTPNKVSILRRNSKALPDTTDPCPHLPDVIEDFVSIKKPPRIPIIRSLRTGMERPEPTLVNGQISLLKKNRFANPRPVKSETEKLDSGKNSDLEEMPILARVEPLRGKNSNKSEKDIPVLLPVEKEIREHSDEEVPSAAATDGDSVSFQVIKKRKKTPKEVTPLKIVKKTETVTLQIENGFPKTFRIDGDNSNVNGTSEVGKARRKKFTASSVVDSTEKKTKTDVKKYFLGICPSEIDKGRNDLGEESGSDSEPLISLVMCQNQKENESEVDVKKEEVIEKDEDALKKKQDEEDKFRKKQDEEVKLRKKQDEEDKLRKKQDEEDKLRKKQDEEDKLRKKRDEEDKLRKKRDEEDKLRKKQDEEDKLRKKQDEEDKLRKKQDEEDKLRKKRDEEDKLRKKQDEEDKLRKKQDEEDKLRKKQDEEVKLKKKQDEEDKLRKKQDEEVKLKKKQDEEDKLRKKQDEEDKLKKKQDEEVKLRKKQDEEDKLRKKQDEEVKLKKKQDEEDKLRKKQDEEDKLRKKRDEEDKLRKKRDEEDKLRKKQDEEDKLKKKQDEENKLKKKRDEEDKLRKKQDEEDKLRKKRDEEDKLKKKQDEEDKLKKVAEEKEKSKMKEERKEVERESPRATPSSLITFEKKEENLLKIVHEAQLKTPIIKLEKKLKLVKNQKKKKILKQTPKRLRVTVTLKEPTLKIVDKGVCLPTDSKWTFKPPTETSSEPETKPEPVPKVDETPAAVSKESILPERRSRRVSKETKSSSEFIIDDPLILVDELWSDLDSDSDSSKKKSKRGKKKTSKKRSGEEKRISDVNLEELLRNFGENKENNLKKVDEPPKLSIKLVSKPKLRPRVVRSWAEVRKAVENREEKKSYRRLSLKLFRFNKTRSNLGNLGEKLWEAKRAAQQRRDEAKNSLPDLPFLAAEIKENPVQVIQCRAQKSKSAKRGSRKKEPKHHTSDIRLKISLPLESINNMAVFNNNNITEVGAEEVVEIPAVAEEILQPKVETTSQAEELPIKEVQSNPEESFPSAETADAGELKNKSKRSEVIDKIFYCEICKTYYYSSSQLKIHKLSNRHKLKESELLLAQQEPEVANVVTEVEKKESPVEEPVVEKVPSKSSEVEIIEVEKLNDDTLEMPTLEGPFIENPLARLGMDAVEPPPQPPVVNNFGFSQESLKDIQRAIGCTDEEMLILTLLGENTIEIENDILDLDTCKPVTPKIEGGQEEKVDGSHKEAEKANGALKLDLKQRMTSALACLVNKAVFNLLQKYETAAKTAVNPEALTLLGKLSSLSRRKNILQLNELLKRQNHGESSIGPIGPIPKEFPKKEQISYKYQCTICGSRFEKASTRECHISRSHKGKAKKLAEDIQVYHAPAEEDWNDSWSYDAGDDHLSGTNTSQFWCSDCGINFLSPQEVLEHQKLEHQAGVKEAESSKEAGPLQSSTIGSSDEIIEGKKPRRRPKLFSSEELDQQRIIANNELRKLDRKFTAKSKTNKIKWGMDALRFTVEKENKIIVEEKEVTAEEVEKPSVDLKSIDLVPKLNLSRTSNIPEFKVIQKTSFKNRFQKIIDNKLKRKNSLPSQQEPETDEVETEVMLVPVVVKKKNKKQKAIKYATKKDEGEKPVDVYDFNESESDGEPVVFSHVKKPTLSPTKLKLVKVKEGPSKNKADSTTKDLAPDDYDSEDSLPLSVVKKSKPEDEDDEKVSEDGVEKSEGILEQVEYLIEQLENETGSSNKQDNVAEDQKENDSELKTEQVGFTKDEASKDSADLILETQASLRVSVANKFLELDSIPLKNPKIYKINEESLDASFEDEAPEREESILAEPESSQSTFDEEDSMPLVMMSKKVDETKLNEEEKKCDENTTDVSTTASEDVQLFGGEERRSSDAPTSLSNLQTPAEESLPPVFSSSENEGEKSEKPFKTVNGNVIYCRNESVSDFGSDLSNDGLIHTNFDKISSEGSNFIKEVTEKEDVVIVCSKGDDDDDDDDEDLKEELGRKRLKPAQRKRRENSEPTRKKKKRFPLLTATIEENNFRKSESPKLNKEVIVRKIWSRQKLAEDSTDNDADSFASLDNENSVETNHNDESQAGVEKEIIVKKIWSRKKVDHEEELAGKTDDATFEDVKINQTEISDEVVIKCGPKTKASPKRRKSRGSANEASKETIMRKIWSGRCTFQTKAALKTYDSDMIPNCKENESGEAAKPKKRGRPPGFSSAKRSKTESEMDKDDEDDLDSLLEEIEREQLEKAIRLEFLQLRRSEKANVEIMKEGSNPTVGLFTETSLKHKKEVSDTKRRKVRKKLKHPRQSVLKRKKFLKKPIRRVRRSEERSFSESSNRTNADLVLEQSENSVDKSSETFGAESKIKNRKHKKHRHKHHHHKHKHKKSKHRKCIVSKHKSKHKFDGGEEASESFSILEKICQDVAGQPDVQFQGKTSKRRTSLDLNNSDSKIDEVSSPLSFENKTKDCEEVEDGLGEKIRNGSIYEFVE